MLSFGIALPGIICKIWKICVLLILETKSLTNKKWKSTYIYEITKCSLVKKKKVQNINMYEREMVNIEIKK